MRKNINDIKWDIETFIDMEILGRIDNLIHPIKTVPFQFIIDNDGSWSSNSADKDDYVYYHIGDFKTGYEVKVKSVEVLRHIMIEKDLKIYSLEDKLMEIGGELDG